MAAFYRVDRWGGQLGRIQQVSEASRTVATDGTDELTLVCGTLLDKGDRVVTVDYNGDPLEWVVTDTEIKHGSETTCTYYCTNSVVDLQLYFIEDRRVRSGGADTALQRALEGTCWTVGSVPSTEIQDISFYHVSAYEALIDICDAWGLELETELDWAADRSGISRRVVNLVNQRGSRNVRRFDFGRNLTEVTRTVDSTNVISRLYPYGNGIEATDDDGEATGGWTRKITIADVNEGLTYIEDEAATELWGIYDDSGNRIAAMGTQDFDTNEPAELLEMAREALPSLTEPTVTYTATVAALGIEGEDRLGVGVGDDVAIIDASFPVELRLSGRILQIDTDWLDPLGDGTTITMGNLTQSYTSSMDKVTQQVSAMASASGVWNRVATADGTYVDSVVDSLNDVFNRTGGYVYFKQGEGIYIYDAPEESATMCIHLGGGYFRIAASKDSAGQWEWRTMGSGEGLVADVIVAGILRGGRGAWNLETGELVMTDHDGNQTVYLDGDGQSNVLTGAFRTRPEGSTDYPYLWIPYDHEGTTWEGEQISGAAVLVNDHNWANTGSRSYLAFYDQAANHDAYSRTVLRASRSTELGGISQLSLENGVPAGGDREANASWHANCRWEDFGNETIVYGATIGSQSNVEGLRRYSHLTAYGANNQLIRIRADVQATDGVYRAEAVAFSAAGQARLGCFDTAGSDWTGINVYKSDQSIRFTGTVSGLSAASAARSFWTVETPAVTLAAGETKTVRVVSDSPAGVGSYAATVSGKAETGVALVGVASADAASVTVNLFNPTGEPVEAAAVIQAQLVASEGEAGE